MGLLLKGGLVYRNRTFVHSDISISDNHIANISPGIPIHCKELTPIQANGCLVLPGFADVHVHLREPGFFYKESIASGTAAGAAGGYTALCSMPNLDPVPDCPENLRPEKEAIDRDALVPVYPYGAISRGQKGQELADMEGLASSVIGFSDDGHGVQSDELMEAAMKTARMLDRPIVAHCEVNALLKKGGCVNEGRWAREHGFTGISSESEWRMVERDLALLRRTGCRYHVCHVSTKESLALIRQAKAEGLPVTCETAPHYLLLCEDDLEDDGCYKMNPPLRLAADRDALIEGLIDGTIDCIATDHAPHSAAEKSQGLRGSSSGIVGLETAFAVLYTGLVLAGSLSLECLVEKLCVNPRRIFGLPGGSLEAGAAADIAVIDIHNEYEIEPASFYSKGRASPFAHWRTKAAVVLTLCGGKCVFKRNGLKGLSALDDFSFDGPAALQPPGPFFYGMEKGRKGSHNAE